MILLVSDILQADKSIFDCSPGFKQNMQSFFLLMACFGIATYHMSVGRGTFYLVVTTAHIDSAASLAQYSTNIIMLAFTNLSHNGWQESIV